MNASTSLPTSIHLSRLAGRPPARRRRAVSGHHLGAAPICRERQQRRSAPERLRQGLRHLPPGSFRPQPHRRGTSRRSTVPARGHSALRPDLRGLRASPCQNASSHFPRDSPSSAHRARVLRGGRQYLREAQRSMARPTASLSLPGVKQAVTKATDGMNAATSTRPSSRRHRPRSRTGAGTRMSPSERSSESRCPQFTAQPSIVVDLCRAVGGRGQDLLDSSRDPHVRMQDRPRTCARQSAWKAGTVRTCHRGTGRAHQ